MKIKTAVLVVIAMLMVFSPSSFAVEGLTISLDCTNVVVRWSSNPTNGETFIVQHRATLNTNDTWETLTNFYPASTETNWTTFVHSNVVTCTDTNYSGGGTNIGGDGPPGPGSFSSGTFSKSGKKNYPPLPPLPPLPWEQSRYSQTAGSSTSSSFETSEANGAGVEMGFYRVVRNDLHIFGLTNGAILSGTVALPVEIGFPDNSPFAGISIQNGINSDAIDGLDIDDINLTGWPQATWDTLQTSNGIYQLNVGAQFGDGTIVEASSQITVTVSNLVWFPNSWNVCGDYINVDAQTVFTNGTYEAELFDGAPVATNSILQLADAVDSEGYITYGGARGFVVLNYDQTTGEQYPSPYYTVVMTITPAGGSSANSVKATNTIIAELSWNYYTKFSIAYMPLFGDWTAGNLNALLLEGAMSAIYSWADTRPRSSDGTPWGTYNGAVRGNANVPFELYGQSNFTADWLVHDLRQDVCRNLYYYGHGGTDILGTKRESPAPTGYVRQAEAENALHNHAKDPLCGFNNHPYRFVFLDGCNTADGDWCKTFGIPKKENMPLADFQNRGLRTRAFVGWDKTVVWAVARKAPDMGHLRFLSGDLSGEPDGLFTDWTKRDETSQEPYGIKRAILEAAAAQSFPDGAKLKVYGYWGLTWFDGP